MTYIPYSDFEANYLFKEGDSITKDRLNKASSYLKKELADMDGTLKVISGDPIQTWNQSSVYFTGEWVSHNGANYRCEDDNVYGAIPGVSSSWYLSPLNSVATSGNLNELEVSGETLVDAINNVNAIANQAISNIGYLSMMPTIEKNNVAGALTEMYNEKGQPNGFASLDSSGKIYSNQLPSYVDDVIEYPDLGSFPETGEAGKIYVAIDTNISYRWSGSQYTSITAGNVDWNNITGTPSTLDGYEIVLTDIPFGDAYLQTINTITTSVTPVDIILGDSSLYRSGELLIQCSRGTDFHTTKMNIIHNGTISYESEYGAVFNNGALATFDTNVTNGNMVLTITPSSGTSTEFKVLATLLKL